MGSKVNIDYLSPDSKVEYIELYFEYYPIEDFRQRVLSTTTDPESVFDGEKFVFRWNEPDSDNIGYSLISQVATKNEFIPIIQKVKFPIVVDSRFTQASEKIDITPEITELASELATGEDDLYMVVFNLANWTQKNIEYDLNTLTLEASQPASWVLENRIGVCDEMTNLFIALSRSLGIPARFISGLSYTNSEIFADEWGLHGWAEVYFPGVGWVPFDTTYGQFGYVDATHVKLKESLESNKSATRYLWKSHKVELSPEPIETDAEILNEGDLLKPSLDIKLSLYEDNVAFGSYNLLVADLKNPHDYYVTSELYISKTQTVEILGDERVNVAVAPKSMRKIYWIVKTPSNLNSRYIYTFPFELITTRNYSTTVEMKADRDGTLLSKDEVLSLIPKSKKTYSRQLELDCKYPTAIFDDERLTVSCLVRNAGNIILYDIETCLEEECHTFDLGLAQSKPIEFALNLDKGIYNSQVTSQGDGALTSDEIIVHVEDRPAIAVSDLEYPDAMFGTDFTIRFNLIQNSSSVPENLNIIFDFNGRTSTWSKDELTGYQPFLIDIEGNSLFRSNTASIHVTYEDFQGNQYAFDESVLIDVTDANLIQRFQMFLNWLVERII